MHIYTFLHICREIFWAALADTFATAYTQLPVDRKKGVISLVKESIQREVLSGTVAETLMSDEAVGDFKVCR